MDAAEFHQRNNRRPTFTETERQLLACCERLALLAKLSRMSGNPISRDELRRQCEGLRRLLTMEAAG